MIRAILSIVAALALAFTLIIAVELGSALVHPFPADFKGTKEEVCKHVERFPAWVLAVAGAAWGGTAYASTWVATRIGNRVTGGIIGALLTLGVIFNVSELPYPMWFEIGIVLLILGAVLLGLRHGRRTPVLAKTAET